MKISDLFFDYENQAWVLGGKYERCGHPESFNCRCYGKLHAGEQPNDDIISRYGQDCADCPPDRHILTCPLYS